MRAVACLVIAAAVLISMAAGTRSGGAFITSLLRQLPGRDSTGHFLLMGAVSFFAVLGFSGSRIAGHTVGVGGVIALVALGVTLDEFAQKLFVRRTFSLEDLMASYAGVLVLGAVAWWVHRRRLPAPTS